MSVRFRIHEKSRMATVAGVDYQDLRSVFTAASIHYHDDLAKLRNKERLTIDDREMQTWIESQLQVLKVIEGAISDGISATYPPRPKPTRAERLHAVQEARKRRVLLDSLTDEIIAWGKAQREST